MSRILSPPLKPVKLPDSAGKAVIIRLIGNLITAVSRIEIRIESYYAAVIKHSKDNGTRPLAYYLIRHLGKLQSELECFGLNKIRMIRKVKMRQAVRISPEEWIGFTKTPPERTSGKTVLEAAIRHTRNLTSLYRNIPGNPLTGNARLLTRRFHNLEQRESSTLKKMLAMHYF